MLKLAHPETAARTCPQCIKWMFNPETGGLVLDKITGEPILRPPGTKTPCLQCSKCSSSNEKSPEAGRVCDLSPRNQLTLLRYWEQQAGVRPPLDDLMIRNLGIIHETISTYNQGLLRISLTMKAMER